MVMSYVVLWEHKYILLHDHSIIILRTNMAAICEMVMNCSKKFHRHLQKPNVTAKHGLLKG